jgi:hypothetical protein
MRKGIGHMMAFLNTTRPSNDDSAAYATAQQLRRVLSEDMDNLYLLAFLLTAKDETARQCIVPGIASSGNEPPFFKQWARSWARRIIIQNAIRLTSPRPGDCRSPRSEPRGHYQTKHGHDPAIVTVLALAHFERFVTVLSIFEELSDHDCSVLLSCSVEQVRNARQAALGRIKEFLPNITEVSPSSARFVTVSRRYCDLRRP